MAEYCMNVIFIYTVAAILETRTLHQLKLASDKDAAGSNARPARDATR